jgi:Cu(I)-responsive transcriptional regulator
MLKDFSIGQIARDAGIKVQTIRYYEQIGLIPPARRSSGNQRQYTPTHLELLKFIRHSRALGFSLDEVRELLTLREAPQRPCDEVDEIARRHLLDVEQKIAQLVSLQGELNNMIGQCAGGTVSSCRIIEVLSDHTRCIADDHIVSGLESDREG